MTAPARIVRLALAAAMLAAAAFLVLLARDAWHWGRAMRDGDARAAAGAVDPAVWQAQTFLPGGFVRGVLGVDDDLAFRRTVTQAIAVATRGTTSRAVRSPVETALGRIADESSDRARASRAADYLGVLLYSDPSPPRPTANPYVNPSQPSAQPPEQQTPEQRALAEFETAVDLDPTNANAKRNLEAMLQQVQPPQRKGAGRAGNGERIGNKGSGSRPAGRGY